MSKWAASLIRISNHEVETLQKRLAEIVDKRIEGEARIAALDAEADLEARRAEGVAEAGWYMIGYRAGLRHRKAEVQALIEETRVEETGARDALALAFEALKKYEHVAEAAKITQGKLMGRLETAALDELGLRRSVGR